MLHIQSFTFNPFQENTYIIYDNSKNCWIVDPGMYEPNEIDYFKKYIHDNKLKPLAIYNTHGHIDHIWSVDDIVKTYNIPFYIHSNEIAILDNAKITAQMFGINFDNLTCDKNFYTENEILNLGESEIKILNVPGHSPGSVALYAPREGWVISGDTLFNGSIGRTDLLLGDYDTLIKSIKTQLLCLPSDIIVFSGHGSSTTIEDELKHNPFLQ